MAEAAPRMFSPDHVPDPHESRIDDPVELLKNAGAIFHEMGEPTVPFESRDLLNPLHPISKIDFSRFDKIPLHVIKKVQFAAALCRAALSGPLFTVEYGHHDERRKWRSAVGQRYGDKALKMYMWNRVRLNVITHLAIGFRHLSQLANKGELDFPKGEELKSIIAQFPAVDAKIYNQLADEDKVTIAKRTSEIARQFLKAVT